MHVALVGAEFEENLAVRYLQGALLRDGHEVTSIVFNDPSEPDRAAAELAGSGAQLAGLSMVFTYRAREFAELANRARALGFRGHLLAGGHFAALNAERLLADVEAFDAVACGEGEEILCALCKNLPALRGVRGLVWRDGDRVVRNDPAEKPCDLDTLAWPPRRSPFDNYLGVPITNILSSRGCTHACSFCSIAAWHRVCGGARLRLRAPRALAEEMAMLYEQGIRIFNFHDDNFVLDDRAAMLARLHDLGAELARRRVDGPIAFAIKCRPDRVDPDVFALLKAMGMFRVFLGVEAGTDLSLRELGRGQTVRQNVQSLTTLNKLDIHTCFNLLMLNPWSTLDDFAANVRFLREHPDNAMNFCRTEVYEGTALQARLRKEGRLLGSYWGWDYPIADPHAQAAFDILYPAFEARNYDEEGLHHLTMQIDYEQQLLRRFFGPAEALRRGVKNLIVEVNHNTCDHLDRVISAARDLPGPAVLDQMTADIRGAVVRDNAALGARVRALLEEIRAVPGKPKHRPNAWLRAAATAGLAATVTIGSASCREKSHPTEMVALPPMSASGPPPDVEPASDAGADDAAEELPSGPPALIKTEVSRRLLPLLVQKVVPSDVVEFEIWVARDGTVPRANVYRPHLAPDAEKAIVEGARALVFDDAAVRGRRFLVYFAKEELDRGKADAATAPAPVPTQTTHLKERIPPRPEMVPRPAPPRPERAPKPPNR
jgi:anaerobic magnesium-protoporphyrin IX monomethyl ester cyclase